MWNILLLCIWVYEGCPESIRPFWISWEPIAWPWCDLAASQKRPYCACVNNHAPVGLVSRQWDAVDWACVLCDRRIHRDRASISAMRLPILQLSCKRLLAKHRISQVCQHPYSPDLAPCDFWSPLPKLKSQLTLRFVNATATQYTSSVRGISLPTD